MEEAQELVEAQALIEAQEVVEAQELEERSRDGRLHKAATTKWVRPLMVNVQEIDILFLCF